MVKPQMGCGEGGICASDLMPYLLYSLVILRFDLKLIATKGILSVT